MEKAVTPLREVNCSVLGYGDHVETSELEMPVTKEEFLTFEGKYTRNAKGAAGMAAQVRIIPAPGKKAGDKVVFGGLLGHAPVLPVHTADCSKFVLRGGNIPAPIHSFKN